MTDTDIVARIRKLLALSESPSEEEARAAAAKAAELMARYNISRQEVGQTPDLAAYDALYIERDELMEPYIGPILRRFFFVDLVASLHRDGWKVVFVGEATNVEVAVYVHQFLAFVFRSLWEWYRRENGIDNEAQDSFYIGMKAGLYEKLAAQEAGMETEMGLIIGPDPGLSIYRKEMFPDLQKAETRQVPLYPNVRKKGEEEGRKIEIRNGVTHTPNPKLEN